MSDPVSNADIEDVLSSIRRLVSEEPSSAARRLRAAEEAASERFVLTPAFRVSEEAEPVGKVHQFGESAALDPAPEQPGEDADSAEMATPEPQEMTEEPVAEQIDEALDGTGDDLSELAVEMFDEPEPHLVAVEPDEPVADTVSEALPEGGSEASLIAEAFEASEEWSEDGPAQTTDATPAEEEPAELAVPAEPAEPELAEQVEVAPESGEMTLEKRIAELEAAIEQSPQEWEPDGSEDGDSDETRPLSYDTDADAAPIAEALSVAPKAEAEAEPEPDNAALHWEDSDDTLMPEHDTERAEHAIVEADEVEPVPEEDATEALRAWQDAPMAEMVEPEAPEPDTAIGAADLDEDDDEAPENAFLADDEAMLDEETLREMVGDLVRQELQGVLGERITRNVRRLVRREIQRAMAMRDLE